MLLQQKNQTLYGTVGFQRLLGVSVKLNDKLSLLFPLYNYVICEMKSESSAVWKQVLFHTFVLWALYFLLFVTVYNQLNVVSAKKKKKV